MAAITITTGARRRVGPTTHERRAAVAGGGVHRSSRAGYLRRRLAVAGLAGGLVFVMAQAGVALGGSSLAAPERRPTVTLATASRAGSLQRGSLQQGSLQQGSLHRVVVRPGDSLWSIAERLAPGADPRPVVDALQQARGNAALVPGETVGWDG
jgi:hypothetical protein